MSNPAIHPRHTLMLELARRAGERAMHFFQSPGLVVEAKHDTSEVTIADREIESLIRDGIRSAFPHDGLIGEEHGHQTGSSGYTWIIDPIDGTTSFVHGVPLFATLIAVQHESDIVAGIIELPALGERVHASLGIGTWWERTGRAPVRASVSTCRDLKQAIVCTTSPTYFAMTNTLPAFDRLTAAVGKVRGWSDAYGYALAATGRIDACLDPLMKPWDNGPMPVIFAEAGGVFSDWHGKTGIDGTNAVGGSGAVVEHLINLFKS